MLLGKKNQKILITSVSKRDVNIPTIELPPLGVYTIDLTSATKSIALNPFRSENQHFETKLKEMKKFLGYEMNINETITDVEMRCVVSKLKSLEFKRPSENELSVLTSVQQLSPELGYDLLLTIDIWRNNVTKLKELLGRYNFFIKKSEMCCPRIFRICRNILSRNCR